MPEVNCPTGDCTFRTESQAEMDLHQQGHKVDTLTTAVHSLAQRVDGLPGSLAAHFHSALDNLEPTHAHLEDMLTYAEDCPGCAHARAEYDTKLRQKFDAEQGEAAEARAAEAEAIKQAEPPKPTPVVPRIFDLDEDSLDLFGVGAFGMEYIEGEEGKYTIKVKAGADALELANEAIADGILPANCVLRVGEDGKTTYVCDSEPAPAPA